MTHFAILKPRLEADLPLAARNSRPDLATIMEGARPVKDDRKLKNKAAAGDSQEATDKISNPDKQQTIFNH